MRDNRARLQVRRAGGDGHRGPVRAGRWSPCSSTRSRASPRERASLDQSYDEGPEGRFGGQQKAAGLILQNPLGLGAQQFVPQYHHEEPHNVYLTMFLNAGWLGGLLFLGLVGTTSVWGLRHAFVRCATQPLFLVVYACFVAHVLEGSIIDLDHWRHFYLLMALVWGLMLSGTRARDPSR